MRQASVVGFAVAVVAMVLLVFQHSLFATGITGLMVQALSVLLMIWARVTFGRRSFHAAANPTEGGLVTSGPYQFIRHPIYAAVLYFAWSGILTHLSVTSLLLGILATSGLALRILAEERLVEERYPEYAGYAARTRRIIPFVL